MYYIAHAGRFHLFLASAIHLFVRTTWIPEHVFICIFSNKLIIEEYPESLVCRKTRKPYPNVLANSLKVRWKRGPNTQAITFSFAVVPLVEWCRCSILTKKKEDEGLRKTTLRTNVKIFGCWAPSLRPGGRYPVLSRNESNPQGSVL